MNTNPDEINIQLWLEDELVGEDQAHMDKWAESQPEKCLERDRIRAMRKLMQANLVSSEEPPYADFFLNRIQQGMRDSNKHQIVPKAKSSAWKLWVFSATGFAAVILAFGLGKWSSTASSPVVSAPLLYTPENGVAATWLSGQKMNSPLIILKGVSPIPDSVEFKQIVHVDTIRESDRTVKRTDEKIKAGEKP